MKITVEKVMATNPCENWPRSRVEEWFGHRIYALSTTMLGNESLDINDRIWLGIYLLDLSPRRLFVCECAERALMRERAKGHEPHADLWRAIEVARQYARGECDVAARDAAYSAAESAARDTANSAARSAANSAARSAASGVANRAARNVAWNAAWNAEKQWQINRLVEYHKGEGR